MNVEAEAEISPYMIEDAPTSNGRVLLSRAFEHYCLLHWGLAGEDIARSFDHRDGSLDVGARSSVLMAARLLGAVLARGDVRAWVRPIGGGEPVPLRASTWEIDDFSQRFARSALDPQRPFDPDARPTHWIFVDVDDWNGIVEATLGERPRIATRASPTRQRSAADETAEEPTSSSSGEARLLRLPEVMRRTGMSRSTIYRKMEAKRFPQSLSLSDNMTAWRENEVDEWVASPR